MASGDDITAALRAWSRSDPDAFDELFQLVVDELRGIAQTYMKSERPDHTLQATALVNEVCIRLMGRRKVSWDTRAQFFAFAGKLMRRLLVEHARRRNAAKRGGGVDLVPLTGSLADQIDQDLPQQIDVDVLLDLNDALDRLGEIDPEAASIVDLRFFSGLTEREVAKALKIPRSTVQRKWRMAKRQLSIWLGGIDPE